jgi:hypothetical protein
MLARTGVERQRAGKAAAVPQLPSIALSAQERDRLEEAAREELGRERRHGDGTTVRMYRDGEAALIERISGARRAGDGYRLRPADRDEAQTLLELARAAELPQEAIEQLEAAVRPRRGGRV